MGKRRKQKRRYRMITFKAFEDSDADILNWWDGIEDGERSDALREVIRVYLGAQPRPRKALSIPELLEVRQDTLWIRDALNDMPAYLERVIQYVATNAQPVVVGQHPPRASPGAATSNDPALTDAEHQRRARRMKGATW